MTYLCLPLAPASSWLLKVQCRQGELLGELNWVLSCHLPVWGIHHVPCCCAGWRWLSLDEIHFFFCTLSGKEKKGNRLCLGHGQEPWALGISCHSVRAGGVGSPLLSTSRLLHELCKDTSWQSGPLSPGGPLPGWTFASPPSPEPTQPTHGGDWQPSKAPVCRRGRRSKQVQLTAGVSVAPGAWGQGQRTSCHVLVYYALKSTCL